MQHIFTEKNIKLFTKTLFEKYTNKHGYSLSNLENKSFLAIDNSFPSVFYEVKENITTPLIVHYMVELTSRGFLKESKESLSFNFTPDGYTQGYKIKHPFKYFLQTQGRWFFGTVIIGLIIAGCTLLAG